MPSNNAAGSEREAFENARENGAECFDTLENRSGTRSGFGDGWNQHAMWQAARAAAPPNPRTDVGRGVCQAEGHQGIGPHEVDYNFCLDWKPVAAAPAPPSREWIPVSEMLPDEEALVLFAAKCQADDCDGLTHTWNEVFRGSIYSTPLQVIATADNGDEYEDGEILGWQPLPAPPVAYSGASAREEK